MKQRKGLAALSKSARQKIASKGGKARAAAARQKKETSGRTVLEQGS